MSAWTERYCSAAFAEAERERLWPAVWLLAGRVAWRRVLDVGAASVVVLRGGGGALRAFHNVCVHRGARLCDGEGEGAALRCGYHGWSYGLDGRLLEAPGCDAVPDAGLLPVRCEERHGFAWVALSESAPPLGEWLGGLDGRLAALGLGQWGVTADVSVELECNWKASCEAHLESLHVATLHGAFAAHIDLSAARVERLGPHAVVGAQENYSLCVFPNVQLNVSPEGIAVLRHRPHPRDPRRSTFDQLSLARGNSGAVPANRRVEPDDRVIGPVTAADLKMSERVQRGLDTGVLERPRLTAAESAIAWLHESIDAALGPVAQDQ